MHKGIVHNDGSAQGLADGPRIGEMYIFPHAWENILNRMLPNRVKHPVTRITFENPPIQGPDEIPGVGGQVRASIARSTSENIEENQIAAGTPPVNMVHRVRLIKYRFQKGEVYKIPHEMDAIAHHHGHIPDIAEYLDGRLIDVVQYEGQSKLRLPWPIWILMIILVLFFIAFLFGKGVNSFEWPNFPG